MKHKTTGAKLGKNSVSGMMFVLRHKCQSDFGGSRSLLAKLVWLRVSVANITRNFVLFSCTNSTMVLHSKSRELSNQICLEIW